MKIAWMIVAMFLLAMGCTKQEEPEENVTRPTIPQTRTAPEAPSQENGETHVFADADSAAPAPVLPVRPLDLFCGNQCTESDRIDSVFYLEEAEQKNARVGATVTLIRPALSACFQIGAEILFARYESASKTAFWIGRGRLAWAEKVAGSRMKFVIEILDYSPSESSFLAPFCGTCEVVQNLYRVAEQKPFVIGVNDTDPPAGISAEQFISVSIPASDFAVLEQVKLPEDKKRPIVLWMKQPVSRLRGALSWLENTKRTGREVYWLYPDAFSPNLIPPPVVGVTEADTDMLTYLEAQNVTAVVIGEIPAVAWKGPVIKLPAAIPLPMEAKNRMGDSDLAGVGETMLTHVEALLKQNPRTSQIVVLSRSMTDYQSYYVVRTLAAARFRPLYWYRSSGESWKRKVAFDPAPPAKVTED